MPRADLSDIIEQRLISDASCIEPTDDEPSRAIDVYRRFAAVYRFAVDE